MLVTFISECEKNALKKTRRVLDSFANRIGNNTWQTPITQEGLDAVQKLLKQTASKNTAVSCHQLKSRIRTELLWVVGNRSKFNNEGIVAVNYTKKDILKNYYENDWKYLPAITSLVALAALFHDFGKSSDFFQARLNGAKNLPKGDPLRHEWISLLFLNSFVDNKTNDKLWLEELKNGEFDENYLKAKVVENIKKPMENMPLVASLVSWLIVSHHRLPTIYNDNWKYEKSDNLQKTLQRITRKWWYENINDGFDENIKQCFSYSNGLPNNSNEWLKQVKKYAHKLLLELHLLENTSENELRFILNYSRLSLMLGDHLYSSLSFEDSKRIKNRELNLFANTCKENGKLKQTLDQHLVGVAKQAVDNTYLLQALENQYNEMPSVKDNKSLKKPSPDEFSWQDTAVQKIIQWRKKQDKFNPNNFGFFAVNMASTGKGKTFANAKIMRSLSKDKESLRYILALGLRTLTLQTGDEYRDRVGLKDDELGVLIGSTAILNLHNTTQDKDENQDSNSGSESQKELSSGEFRFSGNIPDDFLKTLFPKKKFKKNKKFLYAPVLSCTIDYLMSATETNKGGKYILPMLRLMSSDLVIDEIDDFDGTDLIAIGRLIHLAGMLGRKVMISSATITPDLAEGYFNSYQHGWKIYAKTKNHKHNIGCAWIDENITTVKNITNVAEYQQKHNKFINKRVSYLQTNSAKRKVNIVPVNIDGINNIKEHFYSCIWNEIAEKHKHNHIKKDDRKISFGVVRFANINPCIEFTRYLLNVELDENTEIRTMAYHSQQILIMRHEQEKHLDEALKRKKGSNILGNSIIKERLESTTKKNVIFILVATPVEEVGRDHDFDWAIIEPSSYRSFIQLAGRVLRHRDKEILKPNIAIMQYNLRHLKNKELAFIYPGYENENFKLDTHNLEQLIDTTEIATNLDATHRIKKTDNPSPTKNLADLEHQVIADLLTNYESNGPESMQGWLQGFWWLTGMPQYYVKFRDSNPNVVKYLLPDDNFENEWYFYESDDNGITKQSSNINNGKSNYDDLSNEEKSRLWMNCDYEKLLKELATNDNLQDIALVYGELSFPLYKREKVSDVEYFYSHQLGLSRK